MSDFNDQPTLKHTVSTEDLPLQKQRRLCKLKEVYISEEISKNTEFAK